MMEYTDRHMRFLLRLLSTRTVLWTEMVPALTIKHNHDELGRFLDYNDDVEHPVVLQVPFVCLFVCLCHHPQAGVCVCVCVCVFLPIYFGDNPTDQGEMCTSLCSVFRGLHFAAYLSVRLNQPGSHRRG